MIAERSRSAREAGCSIFFEKTQKLTAELNKSCFICRLKLFTN